MGFGFFVVPRETPSVTDSSPKRFPGTIADAWNGHAERHLMIAACVMLAVFAVYALAVAS